ncbi:metal-dependent hydrolase [candidate division KSB1 bacterium]|nr:metal-dependent hydrolase [candidate division KSB1 bacterium]
MSDFAGHSRAGIKTFLWLSIPILLWQYFKTDSAIGFLKALWCVPVCFALCYFGALFPDVDIKSKSQKIVSGVFIIIIAIFILAGYYGWAAGFGIFILIASFFKHRGFMHSKWAAFLLPLPLLIVPLLVTARLKDIGIEYYLSAVAGYLSHLRSDSSVVPGKWRKKLLRRDRLEVESGAN